MKIAYIVNEDISKHCGVVEKIRSQTYEWEKVGHSVKVFSLSARGTKPLLDNGVIVGEKVLKWGLEKLRSYFQKTKRLNTLLKEYKPDIVYMRYIPYFPFMLSTLKNNAPYIVEINSSDVNEFRKRFKKYRLYNALTRGVLLGNASGFVAVSHELERDKDFKKYNRPAIVIGNGIKTQSVNKKTKQEIDLDSSFQAVFIGSANSQFWHGLDKLLYIIKYIPDVIFHIIGPSIEDMRTLDKDIVNISNIQVHGYLNEKEAQSIVKQCDVGFSTLALHRKDMEEASPLKSRQYLAQGLPIITGYNDTDMLDSEPSFILNIGNYEDNVKNNLDRIKEFITNSRRFQINEIQDYAKEYLDYEKKEEKRIDFFTKILKNEM